MTVIAWDGKTLSADKQAVSGGYGQTVTKIFKLCGELYGFAGNAGHAAALVVWFNNGAIIENWPEPSDKEDVANFIVITKDGQIREYEGGACGYYDIVEDRFTAMGSGRDYALAAMYLGQDSRTAVEVACALDINCGKGIDTLTLKD